MTEKEYIVQEIRNSSFKRIKKLLKNQTEEICFAAVKENSLVLEYIEKQTPKICIEALKKMPVLYRDVNIVDNPDYETTLQNLEKQLLKEKISKLK